MIRGPSLIDDFIDYIDMRKNAEYLDEKELLPNAPPKATKTFEEYRKNARRQREEGIEV